MSLVAASRMRDANKFKMNLLCAAGAYEQLSH